MNQSTLRYFSSVWAVGGPALDSLYAAGAMLLAGGTKPGILEIKAAKQRSMPRQAAPKEGAPGKTLLVEIAGTITKYDQECGPIGTHTMRGLLAEADQSGQYEEIVFMIDSGGGEADGTGLLAHTIAAMKTPTRAIISGLCCSAAYHIASACNSIEATSNTDMIGCIGTMMTIKDIRAKLESEGIKLTEIYASASTEKNKEFIDAMEGDYTALTEILDVFNEDFLSFVKRRPGLKEEALNGKTYTAKNALKMGLIDKITSPSAGNSLSNNKNKDLMKTYSKINAIVGFALLASLADVEGSAAGLDAIEAALGQADTDIAALKAEKAALVAEIHALESAPGANPTLPITAGAGDKGAGKGEFENALMQEFAKNKSNHPLFN